MTNVTRRALRIYAALAELRPEQGDVLDALVPFFEPILQVMNGKTFDPRLFALGVQKLYRWRFTADIAEQFVPRLAKKGYLQRMGRAGSRDAAYVVKFDKPQEPESGALIAEFLEQLIQDFVQFTPRVTNLLTYDRTPEELTDMLLRFLVSLDAYGETELIREVERASFGGEAKSFVAKLEEGGSPLGAEDRYMCARFVKHVLDTKPAYVPQLARLASIGLLTEVVADFIKPTQPSTRADLTIAVDAPLALDYLGCSGKALQNDAREIFDALRAIGCNFVVFGISCDEMQRNLKSMLSLPAPRRRGYTHDAIVRGEVLIDFAVAVSRDPEAALNKAGISVKHVDLKQYPAQHAYFEEDRYVDFLSTVHWVQDVAPRAHDATCMTLIMRMRHGRHSSDVFKSGYVFVTRNGAFVRGSRNYCLESGLLSRVHQGPVIHQRELATIAWLRTGLGADDRIPRGHLVAICERVLRVRPEVKDAVANVLKQVTPEKLEQFELLLSDHKSVAKLADQTLNDETVVTSENAERLLELMKQAAIEEHKQAFDAKLSEERAKHRRQQKLSQDKMLLANEKLFQARAELEDDARARESVVDSIVFRTNRLSRVISGAVAVVLFLLGGIGVIDAFTSYFSGPNAHPWIGAFWRSLLIAAGTIGGYHLIMDILQRPKVGLMTVLNWLAETILKRRLKQKELHNRYSAADFVIEKGQVNRRSEAAV